MKIRRIVFVLTLASLAFAAAPVDYYNPADGLTGASLRSALHDIIDDHTVKSYDYLWTAFASTDINTSLGADYIWCMYTDQEFHHDENQSTGTEVYTTYNREHSWPKSWTSEYSPHYSDLFHLYPVQAYSNSNRSNLPYGEVESGSATYTSANGTQKGPARSGLGYTGTVFEPIDTYKGDFARTYFYISTRYFGEDSTWDPDHEYEYMAIGAELKQWAIDMLMDWHHNDPVSTKETLRNDAVYVIQGNRNPFIDHPEYVASIWTSSTAPFAAPTAQAASNVGLYAFTANWSSIGAATGYNLYVSTASDFSSYISGYDPKDVGNVTSETLSSLSSNTNYYYRVRAYDATDESENSNEISLTTSATLTAPTVQEASAVSSSAFTANWSTVSGATGYNLYVSTSSDFSNYLSGYGPKDVANVSIYQVTALSTFTDYYYRLTAYSDTETSIFSSTEAVKTLSVSGGNGGVFFSEYIEGSSNNKAIEIFNATEDEINLEDITIKLYNNGSTSASTTLQLSGVLGAQEVYAIRNSGVSLQDIIDESDLISGVTNYNGDDALELYYKGSLVDAFGIVGTDPGTSWSVAGNSSATVEHTLLRKSSIIQGNTDWLSSAGTTSEDSEWIIYAQDETSNFGTHVINESGTPISLLSFTTEYLNGFVHVSWSTASEKENAAFNLYRNNELIARIEGAGTSTETREYQYSDARVIPGLTYEYYIEDVSYSGKTVAHKKFAKSITLASEIILPGIAHAAYPNPFNPQTTLPLSINTATIVNVSVHDLQGKKSMNVLNSKLAASEYDIPINMSSFSSGVYILRVQIGGHLQVQKIVLSK